MRGMLDARDDCRQRQPLELIARTRSGAATPRGLSGFCSEGGQPVEKTTPAPFSDAIIPGASVLAWQVDRVVGEPQRDRVERNIRERNLLREHDVVVSVLADERRRVVGTDGELPDLELLRSDARLVRLDQRDLIEQPKRAAGFGYVVGAFGEDDFAVKRVAVEGFGAGEHVEAGLLQGLGRHDGLSWLREPLGGGEAANRTGAPEARRHRQRGISEGRPGGEARLCRESALTQAGGCHGVRAQSAVWVTRGGMDTGSQTRSRRRESGGDDTSLANETASQGSILIAPLGDAVSQT